MSFGRMSKFSGLTDLTSVSVHAAGQESGFSCSPGGGQTVSGEIRLVNLHPCS